MDSAIQYSCTGAAHQRIMVGASMPACTQASRPGRGCAGVWPIERGCGVEEAGVRGDVLLVCVTLCVSGWLAQAGCKFMGRLWSGMNALNE